jgi:hypothetical protein
MRRRIADRLFVLPLMQATQNSEKAKRVFALPIFDTGNAKSDIYITYMQYIYNMVNCHL